MAVSGQPHLISQHAVHGQALAVDSDDHAAYVALLKELAREHHVAVHAYAVLPQEVLLLATPEVGQELSRLMQAIGRRYVSRFNRRHGRQGSLWEGRYRAAVVDAREWLLPALLFIDQAAVRLGHAAQVTDYPWSSAAHYLGRRVDPIVTPPPVYWSLGNTPFDREARYRELDEQALTTTALKRIEAALRGGWVLGDAAFHAQIHEAVPGRPTAPRPRGRPRSQKNRAQTTEPM